MENMYEALTSKDALRAMTCDQDFDDLESVETRDDTCHDFLRQHGARHMAAEKLSVSSRWSS